MGHYACDMRPEWFGEEKPTKKQRNTDNDWVVADDFTVMTALEFQESHACRQTAFLHRMSRKHYRTRLNAEKAARRTCEEAVEATRENLMRLKNILKVQRPWEQK